MQRWYGLDLPGLSAKSTPRKSSDFPSPTVKLCRCSQEAIRQLLGEAQYANPSPYHINGRRHKRCKGAIQQAPAGLRTVGMGNATWDQQKSRRLIGQAQTVLCYAEPALRVPSRGMSAVVIGYSGSDPPMQTCAISLESSMMDFLRGKGGGRPLAPRGLTNTAEYWSEGRRFRCSAVRLWQGFVGDTARQDFPTARVAE